MDRFLKIVDGKVHIVDKNGNLKRVINTKDAVDAIFVGDRIQVKLSNGKSELRDHLGNLKKMI
jgi:hypothetical protein